MSKAKFFDHIFYGIQGKYKIFSLIYPPEANCRYLLLEMQSWSLKDFIRNQA